MPRAALAAAVALLFALPAYAGEAPRSGGAYRYPLRYSPKTLDPARSTDIYTVTIVQQLFDGLVDFDRDLSPIPALAQSWRVSRDGRIYTFEVRRGVRFHNGREVAAEDVVYSITRLVHPDTQSSAASQFEIIAGARDLRQGRVKTLRGVRALDRYRVEIALEEPYTPFLSLLAMKGAKIVPREAVEAKDPAFERAPVGTGPFRFVRWEDGKEIVLEGNPDYFRGRPHLDRLVYAILPSATDAGVYQEFRAGAFEESPVPSDLREEVLVDGAVQVIRRPILGVQFYAFNLSRPEWRERKARQAVMASLDRAAVVNRGARGRYRPTAGLLPPGLLGYHPDRPVPPADAKGAANLLHEGAPGGLPPITVWSGVRTELAQVELDAIREAWTGLGLSVETRYTDDWPQFQQFMREGKMSVFRRAWFADLPDPDNVLRILFHSRSEYNYIGYANPSVDRLLDQGRAELDPVRRAEMYREAEDKILADVPVIPLLHFWIEQAYQPYVKGVEVSALGAPYVPMRKVWLDRRPERAEAR